MCSSHRWKNNTIKDPKFLLATQLLEIIFYTYPPFFSYNSSPSTALSVFAKGTSRWPNPKDCSHVRDSPVPRSRLARPAGPWPLSSHYSCLVSCGTLLLLPNPEIWGHKIKHLQGPGRGPRWKRRTRGHCDKLESTHLARRGSHTLTCGLRVVRSPNL